MRKEELKVVLEAQLPKSYQSNKALVEDEQEESANTGIQPESSKPAAQQEASKPAPRQGCASPEYESLFVEWPFKARSRGQTSMPPLIASLINKLPTKEERSTAMQLWNRSLPVCANVGVIEYNRVDAVNFKEKVGEKFGEGWWRRLEDLARELNEAAGVVVGKGKSGGMIRGKGKGIEGKALDEGSTKEKGPEIKNSESSTGSSKKSEMKKLNETARDVKEPEMNTLDQLAEAATLVEMDEGSKTKTTNSTIGEGNETPAKPEDETTEAAMSLLSLAESPADHPPNDPSALFVSNALSALWYLIDRFFSSGPSAASYFFVALEAAIRLDKTTIHPLHIPAPPAFWSDSADWSAPKVGLTLVLTLAASERDTFDAFARFSKSLGKPALRVEEMRKKGSASLRKAVLRAKDDAERKRRTTVLGVELRDLLYAQLCEVHGKDIEKHFATFARMFVLGVCPGGAKLWLVGGEWGETGTVWESNCKVGAAVGTWEEMDEFVRAFEGFAVSDGQWNSKRFKWFHRCFAVDLKQFDLQIDEEEKKKRGMEPKGEGVKRLLNEIEAWASIYKIEDVKVGDVGKFTWL